MPPSCPTPPTFEQALDELDALVRRMEAGELTLDESIAAYRRGAELARYCKRVSPRRNWTSAARGRSIEAAGSADSRVPARDRRGHRRPRVQAPEAFSHG